jgi:hypothetical protein
MLPFARLNRMSPAILLFLAYLRFRHVRAAEIFRPKTLSSRSLHSPTPLSFLSLLLIHLSRACLSALVSLYFPAPYALSASQPLSLVAA